MRISMTRALGAGAAGALVLTTLHETARRFVPAAPRMDIVAMRALERLMRSVGRTVPDPETLHRLALAGDLLSNSLYYALVPARSTRAAWARGVVLGLLAGTGAVVLPEPLGLGSPPHGERADNRAMTVAWYLAGALAAAAVSSAVRPAAARCPASDGPA